MAVATDRVGAGSVGAQAAVAGILCWAWERVGGGRGCGAVLVGGGPGLDGNGCGVSWDPVRPVEKWRGNGRRGQGWSTLGTMRLRSQPQHCVTAKYVTLSSTVVNSTAEAAVPRLCGETGVRDCGKAQLQSQAVPESNWYPKRS